MAGSNWAQLLPHVSPPPDQVEKQWWSAVPAWGGQLGGGGGHEQHAPGAQGLHDSCCSVTDTAVCSPFLVQTEGEEWGWQGTLRLARVHFSSEGDSGGTLLLRTIVLVIPLLLVMAGDVETNPEPEGNVFRGGEKLHDCNVVDGIV